jgi:hypothetical protein
MVCFSGGSLSDSLSMCCAARWRMHTHTYIHHLFSDEIRHETCPITSQGQRHQGHKTRAKAAFFGLSLGVQPSGVFFLAAQPC